MFYPMQLRISVGGKKIVLREILILRNRWKGTTYVENRAVAIGTAGREDAVVVGFAIWLAVSLEEVLGSQFLVAVRTSEVLGMPRLSQSCYNLDQMVGEKLVFGNHFHLHGWKRRRRKKKKKRTWPTIGLLQALQCPLAVVFTPSLSMSDWRVPSIESNWLLGFGFCTFCGLA